jgi:hypothetical protein
MRLFIKKIYDLFCCQVNVYLTNKIQRWPLLKLYNMNQIFAK